MTRLHLGCGDRKIHGWVNIDARAECNPDIVADITKISEMFKNVDVIYNSHVLEHHDKHQVPKLLNDWYDALKPGGILRISVPNFEMICKHYMVHKDLKTLYGLAWGGAKNDYDYHYIGFDFDTLKEYLENAGFQNVRRYDRWKTEHFFIDDYSAASLSPPFSREGMQMSLNVEATK